MTKALVLRTCASDLKSYGGFQWPSSGKVIAPDWDPKPECGNGLHGALYGEGNGDLLDFGSDSKWLVVEVELKNVVDLGGKVKFPECKIKYCGDRLGASKYLQENGCDGREIIGGYSTSGDYGRSITGYRGESSSGYKGTSISGYFGTSISKNYGESISRNWGASITGAWGVSISRDGGISISGDFGRSISGIDGRCQSGFGGEIISRYWNGVLYRTVVGYVSVVGSEIEPNVLYRLNKIGKWIRADDLESGLGRMITR